MAGATCGRIFRAVMRRRAPTLSISRYIAMRGRLRFGWQSEIAERAPQHPSATRLASDTDCRLEDKQPGHGPTHPAPADHALGHCRSWSTTAHGPRDRSPPPQREVHVDQDAWAGTRYYRSPSRRSPSRHPSATRCRAETDRKSTRLNSSHGYISYAVFCLKKKKRTANG